MSAAKLLHYYPGAVFNWTSEGDWSALEWLGPDDKPDEATFDALPWPSVLTLDEAKTAKKVAVKAHQAALFLAGWTHDFGAAGTHTLDLRDADDKANWTLLLIKTSGMISAGAGTATVELRTAANDTITLSATDANAAMALFLAWGEDMLKRKWVLDGLIDAAADESALGAIDITVGWP